MPAIPQPPPPSPEDQQLRRKELLRVARLNRLRELLTQAKNEHCFDHEDLDAEAEDAQADVDALVALADTFSVQRRAGVKVSFAGVLAGQAVADRTEVARARNVVAEANAIADQAIADTKEATAALERERTAHRSTAAMLQAANDELETLKGKSAKGQKPSGKDPA